jgi:hypothetical protein
MMRTLCILALGAGLAAAQTLTETAISATGGSAAGAAGKSVSDGIDKIFGLLKTQTAHAAEPSQPKSTSKPAAAPEQAGSSQSAAPAGHRRHPSRTPAGAVAAAPVPLSALVSAKTPRPDPVVLACINVGATRQELLAKVGVPSSRIMMGEDGHLVEVFRYSARDATLASFRLVDGTIVSLQMGGH